MSDITYTKANNCLQMMVYLLWKALPAYGHLGSCDEPGLWDSSTPDDLLEIWISM